MKKISGPPAERRSELETNLRAEIATAETEIGSLDRILAEKFPEYAELTNPQPLPLAKAQSLLEDGEALAVYVEAKEATYVCIIREEDKDGCFLTLKPGWQTLAQSVSRLRAGLDPHSGRQVKPLFGGGPEMGGFDVKLAHQLYQQLWAPIEPFLTGVKLVFVVPDRTLESLPVHVLVTTMPAEVAGTEPLRDVAWLAKRPYAVSVLPAVSSLRALRELASKTKPGDGFIGFGNPVLGGEKEADVAAVSLNWRGTVANVDELRSFAPVRGSAAELEQLAQSLSTLRKAIFLGPQATERQVKALSASGDLGKAGIVAFATHGAMAGELKGSNEPGLVLTPPAKASEEDDGFLTASEVAQLSLNADWVILSACNTASADGTPGAEGFSGLTRAFFYAGARALLVSHWSVYSEAAVKLTTGTLGRIEHDPTIGRAEALRRTMVDLVEEGPNPSPAYWAPFVIVGEARFEGRSRASESPQRE